MSTQPVAQQGQQAGQGQGIDATEIAKAFAAAMQQNQPPPQQPQLTPDQLDQMLRTYRPDQALHDALFGENASAESRMAALGNLVQGIVANATAHAQVLANDYISQYHQSVSPHLEDAKYLSQTRFYDDLYKDAPGLKQYEPLVKEYLPKFQNDKDFPQERDKRVSFVKDKFTGLMKQVDPNFDPVKVAQAAQGQQGSHYNSPQQPTQQPTSAAPSLPALAAGASGGGQGSSQTAAPASKMGWSIGG